MQIMRHNGAKKVTQIDCKAFKFLHSWKVKVKSLNRIWLFAAPWTVAYQAPPSMGFSRPEYWSGLPFPSPVIKYEVSGCEWSEVAQSCPTLCDPMDGSLPGSSIHGIFQARILEWGANVVLNLSQPDLENDKLGAAEMEKSSRSSDTTGRGWLRLPW